MTHHTQPSDPSPEDWLHAGLDYPLDQGYPVYFMTFSPEPAPGQTIAAVQQAGIRFLDEVARRHPGAPKPAVIGNCQAGWAAALIFAHADLALNGLAVMLPTQAEREEAFDIAMKIAIADFRVDLGERRLLTRIRRVLEFHDNDSSLLFLE
jgi:hypothetical protein